MILIEINFVDVHTYAYKIHIQAYAFLYKDYIHIQLVNS